MTINIKTLLSIYDSGENKDWIAIPDSKQGIIVDKAVNTDDELGNSWKIHISIDPQQMSDAAKLITEVLNQPSSPRVSIKFASKSLAATGQPCKQVAFLFYQEELADKQKITNFFNQVEKILSQHNIGIDHRAINSDEEIAIVKYDAQLFEDSGKASRFTYRNEQCLVISDEEYIKEFGNESNITVEDPRIVVKQSYYLSLPNDERHNPGNHNPDPFATIKINTPTTHEDKRLEAIQGLVDFTQELLNDFTKTSKISNTFRSPKKLGNKSPKITKSNIKPINGPVGQEIYADIDFSFDDSSNNNNDERNIVIEEINQKKEELNSPLPSSNHNNVNVNVIDNDDSNPSIQEIIVKCAELPNKAAVANYLTSLSSDCLFDAFFKFGNIRKSTKQPKKEKDLLDSEKGLLDIYQQHSVLINQNTVFTALHRTLLTTSKTQKWIDHCNEHIIIPLFNKEALDHNKKLKKSLSAHAAFIDRINEIFDVPPSILNARFLEYSNSLQKKSLTGAEEEKALLHSLLKGTSFNISSARKQISSVM